VESDAFKATHAQRQQRPFVLEPSELALNRAPFTVSPSDGGSFGEQLPRLDIISP
jgi:hypothetical protein